VVCGGMDTTFFRPSDSIHSGACDAYTGLNN
jgi:hypothetical protein